MAPRPKSGPKMGTQKCTREPLFEDPEPLGLLGGAPGLPGASRGGSGTPFGPLFPLFSIVFSFDFRSRSPPYTPGMIEKRAVHAPQVVRNSAAGQIRSRPGGETYVCASQKLPKSPSSSLYLPEAPRVECGAPAALHPTRPDFGWQPGSRRRGGSIR